MPVIIIPLGMRLAVPRPLLGRGRVFPRSVMAKTAYRYPLAQQGVFRTIQGEGALLGVPIVFVRLAGCSVGCPQCDTDYRVYGHWTPQEIGVKLLSLPRTEWIWVTGGEPADHDLRPLIEELRQYGKVALATSGHKPLGGDGRLVDFLSVSPHDPDKWELRRGEQLNLVPGLNGLKLSSFENTYGEFPGDFTHLYVTPLYGSPESLRECLAWLDTHPNWRLGCQAHRQWNLP